MNPVRRVVVVLGTRPQIVKVSKLVPALREARLSVSIVHTGQHYDEQLSGRLFEDLGMDEPDVNLGVGSGTFAYQIGTGVVRLRTALSESRPDAVIVIGDSNPALVGSLAAVGIGIPLFHCEAGLRNGDFSHPEERNRVFIDAMADVLFCPMIDSIANLEREDIRGEIVLTGDLLKDAWIDERGLGTELPVGLTDDAYFLLTLHRRTNVYNDEVLMNLVSAFIGADLGYPIVWPVHPGVRIRLERLGLTRAGRRCSLTLIPAASYSEMKKLERSARAIISDSVGVQVEAYFAGRKCFIPRNSIEYGALVRLGASEVHPSTSEGVAAIMNGLQTRQSSQLDPDEYRLFGCGESALLMASIIQDYLG